MDTYLMPKTKRVFFLMFLFALFFSNAFSQENNRFAKQGTFELGGTISYLSNTNVYNGETGYTIKVFSISPYIGYFVADGFELGFNPLGVTMSSFSGGSTVTQMRIFVAPSYNFTTGGNVYPFVETLFGYTSLSSSGVSPTRDGFSWGGRGGFKWMVTEKGFLNIGVQYLLVTVNQSGASQRNGSNEFSFSAGFTIWF